MEDSDVALHIVLGGPSKRRSKCKIKSAPLLEALCLLLPLSIERANYLLK